MSIFPRLWNGFRRAFRLRAAKISVELQPKLVVVSEEGWLLLSLAVTNRSDAKVWAEEATIILGDLKADLRTAQPTGKHTRKIREFVRPGETLHIGLIEAVYTAAGQPQGEYSFIASGFVRYHIGEEVFDKEFEMRRVKMFALNAIEVRRSPRGAQVRWSPPPK
jgi:hypothetical protein